MSEAKYYIYRNLHTGGFSVRYKGTVIKRVDRFMVKDGIFKVNEKGRQRVIQEKRKNVHAFLVCAPTDFEELTDNIMTSNGLDKITYNPYTEDYFHITNSTQPIGGSENILGINGQLFKF